MDSVYAAAAAAGWPDSALHKEYFSVPEAPDYVNHPFRVRRAKSGRTVEVPADKPVTDVLRESGLNIETKCSDGICGICAAHYVSGEIEHRDYVLSAKDRESRVILCCSRAKLPDGEIVLDL
jgi:ferredoxin